MEPRYRLHYAPDNASLIIRLALEELCLPYETILVDRRVRAQAAPDYLALNPNGTIPVLETPDGVIFETAAILLWLADRHEKLAPSPQSLLRAPFLKWLFWCSNTLQADLRQHFYPDKFIGQDPADQAKLRAVLCQKIRRNLHIIDAGLRETPGLVAMDSPTLLDPYLCCLLRWSKLYANPPEAPWMILGDYPSLLAMCKKFETRNSVKAAQYAEGLGPTPFTAPVLATPPEGSAT